MKHMKKFFESIIGKLSVTALLAAGVFFGLLDPTMAALAGAAVLAVGIEAQGTILAISTIGSPESYSTIPNVINFKGPGGAANVIDVTNLASAAKEKMMGLPDEGQFTFELNYDPDNAVHQSIRSARQTRSIVQMKVTFTDTAPASTAVFNAYILGFEISAGVDNVVKAAVTLAITGAVAFN